MYSTQILLLAYSSLALATPQYWPPSWEPGHNRHHHSSSDVGLSTVFPSSLFPFPTGTAPAYSSFATVPASSLAAPGIPGGPVSFASADSSIERRRSSIKPVSQAPSQVPSQVPSHSSSAPPTQSSSPSTGGTTYSATFTEYGSGDQNGSPNCNTATAACGFYTTGFNAAASQNLFGVGDGQGAGPACGTCWQLTPETDPTQNPPKTLAGAASIVVKVNNLCPADSNPLCAQSGLSGSNQYGANVNFDLCKDDGAASALFGSSGVGLAKGTVTQVDCSEWSGGPDITKRFLY